MNIPKTMAELNRLCTFIASTEDDKQYFEEKRKELEAVHGACTVLVREGDDFVIRSSADSLLYQMNDCGIVTLYKLIPQVAEPKTPLEEQLQEKIAHLTTDLEQAEGTISQQEDTIAELEKDVRRLESKIYDAERERDSLQNDLDNKDREMNNLQKQYDNCESERSDLEYKLREAQREIRDLESRQRDY